MTTKPVPIETLEARTPIPGVDALRLMGENVMVQHVTMAKGAVAPVHNHVNEQIMVLLSGAVTMTVDGTDYPMTPGQIVHLPPHIPHGAVAVEDSVILDVFSPPSQTTGIDQG